MARITQNGWIDNPDGTRSPRMVAEAEPGEHVLLTGPIQGMVEVDGEWIDVSNPVLIVDSPERALAISDAIGRHYEANGHPGHKDGVPFVHTPSNLSHSRGKPSQTFADAVHNLAPAGTDSSPQAVIDHLKKKG